VSGNIPNRRLLVVERTGWGKKVTETKAEGAVNVKLLLGLTRKACKAQSVGPGLEESESRGINFTLLFWSSKGTARGEKGFLPSRKAAERGEKGSGGNVDNGDLFTSIQKSPASGGSVKKTGAVLLLNEGLQGARVQERKKMEVSLMTVGTSEYRIGGFEYEGRLP